MLDPDWAIIGALLAGLCFLVFGVISSLYFFRKQAWKTKSFETPRFRENALKHGLVKENFEGRVLPAQREAARSTQTRAPTLEARRRGRRRLRGRR